MTQSDDQALNAAMAAGILIAGDAERRALLQSIAEVARAIFHAQAASIFLHDTAADELVFEAAAGEGGEDLVGMRFPSGSGIAGWVLSSRQPLVIEDLSKDARFARDVAESTGYVPDGLMAAPLLADEEAIGVLEVLDRPQRARFSLSELELLGQFANQAAIALAVTLRARRVADAARAAPAELRTVARIAAALERDGGAGRDRRMRLLEALADVLERP
jgi:GAF domain-containing protein